MKIFYSTLFLLFFLGSGKTVLAQRPDLDSLETLLLTLPEDTNKINVLGEVTYQYMYKDRVKGHQYANELLALSEKLNNKAGIGNAKYLMVVLEHFDGKSENAIRLGEAALDWAKKNDLLEVQAQVLNMMCLAAQTLNQLDRALEYILEATEVAKKQGDKHRIAVSYYTTGSVYEYLEEEETAKKYLLQALELFQDLGDDYRAAVVYQGLSVVTPPAEAVEYARKGLEGMRKTSDLQGQGMALWTMGASYLLLNQSEEGYKYLQEAYDLFTEIDYADGLSNVAALLGKELAQKGNLAEAKIKLLQADSLARNIGADDILGVVYQGWSLYYGGLGELKKAGNYLDSALIVKDTLFSREKADFLLMNEAELNTQEVKAQNAEQALELEQSRRLKNAILLGALLVIAVLILIFQFYRNRLQKKRQAAELDLQRKKAEADKLMELDALKSSFFANISHEFRTPLSLILGPIHHAEEKFPASEMVDSNEEVPISMRHLQVMKRNALRLNNLINQLLDLAKLEGGDMKLQVQKGAIIKLLRNLVFSFESLAERKRILYQTEFPEEIPTAYFDADKLEKMVINLLSNAFKFTPEKGTISVVVQPKNGHLRIRISDTGKGIPTKDVDKIFNRFYQVSDTDHQGTGIGLSLVKELVDLHKGNIMLESVEGEGSTFILSIPIAASYYEKTEMKKDAPIEIGTFAADTLLAMEEGAEANTVMKVEDYEKPIALIVEDNPDLRSFISESISIQYRVITANDGQDGLDMAIDKVPDVIISDVMMPRMDGFALSKALRQNEKTSHIPIILLTAKAGQDHKIEGLETGVDDYLTKPFDRSELLVRMQNLIEQRKRLRKKYLSALDIKVPANELSSMDERFVRDVFQRVNENLGNEFYTVEELAKSVGFSRSQLHRKMKALLEKSPNEFIRDVRLAHAKELLANKTATVSEIAFQVGYSNLSYFSKSFKTLYGKTPSEI